MKNAQPLRAQLGVIINSLMYKLKIPTQDNISNCLFQFFFLLCKTLKMYYTHLGMLTSSRWELQPWMRHTHWNWSLTSRYMPDRRPLQAPPSWCSGSGPWCRTSCSGRSSGRLSAISSHRPFPGGRTRKHLAGGCGEGTCDCFWKTEKTALILTSSGAGEKCNLTFLRLLYSV